MVEKSGGDVGAEGSKHFLFLLRLAVETMGENTHLKSRGYLINGI